MTTSKTAQDLNTLYTTFKNDFIRHYKDKIAFEEFEFFFSVLDYFLSQKAISIASKPFHLLTISIVQHQIIQEIKHLVALKKRTSSHFNREFLETFLETNELIIEKLEIKLSEASCLLIKHIHNIRFKLFSPKDFDPVSYLELLKESFEYSELVFKEYDTFLSEKIEDLSKESKEDLPTTKQDAYLG